MSDNVIPMPHPYRSEVESLKAEIKRLEADIVELERELSVERAATGRHYSLWESLGMAVVLVPLIAGPWVLYEPISTVAGVLFTGFISYFNGWWYGRRTR